MRAPDPRSPSAPAPAPGEAPRHVLVVIGAEGASPASGSIPPADRAAIGLALSRFAAHESALLPPAPGGDPGEAVPPGPPPPFDVAAVSLDGDTEALRYALAAGADRAALAEDPWQLEFDVALLGEAGAAPWGDGLAAVLAEAQGAALVVDVLDVEWRAGVVRILRDLGRGAREIFAAEGPVVLACSPEAERPRYVGRRRWRAADPDRIGRQEAAGPGRLPLPPAGAEAWEPARPRTRGGKRAPRGQEALGALFGITRNTGGEQAHIVQADPETCARHLLRFLSHHGYIETPAPDDAVATAAAGAGAEEAAGTAAPATDSAGTGQEPAAPPRLRRGPRPRQGPASGRARWPRPVGTALQGDAL